ncbi:5-(carboxyamino)imidazole ribonucleotide synthase [Rummeliibacillus stabekisii]|uniref:N5-carboxyaminoimidazole ribonucleotide synthase n=1 Tax=Rummeliibacillus stabekisii TaxID=241244 RepID=A0A143HA81_9BACL|nr:5-(carboxyamino)imidazole ribonucleotide synthase [Rummeliibacillus stabekisii]AMW98231.1 5-(carboxyamino)imidazole ribonucleotide synthase [Rummeliibacillus stabekisii]
MNNLHSPVIVPGQTIGIIGGGQLGRMMAIAAKAMGFRVAVLDPTPNGPCAQVADIEIIGAYDDTEKLQELADPSDVITFEFENISSPALNWLSDYAYLPQGSALLRISQNRIAEKTALKSSGVEVAPYCVIQTLEELAIGVEKIGFPCVLKTARGGYDGKGQLVIKNRIDLSRASDLIQSNVCVLEAWVPYVKEISVILTRKADGECTCFPIAENIHQDNILAQTIVPARISEKAAEEATKQAMMLAEKLEVVGTLAVEMFLTEEDKVIMNELAPRPHNSGHFTLDACETSQFEQHIRAICNWPLGSTELLKPVVMMNLLGQHMENAITTIPHSLGWKYHIYGKKEAAFNRKMGHINILHRNTEEALMQIEKSRLWKTPLNT